ETHQDARDLDLGPLARRQLHLQGALGLAQDPAGVPFAGFFVQGIHGAPIVAEGGAGSSGESLSGTRGWRAECRPGTGMSRGTGFAAPSSLPPLVAPALPVSRRDSRGECGAALDR